MSHYMKCVQRKNIISSKKKIITVEQYINIDDTYVKVLLIHASQHCINELLDYKLKLSLR